MPEAAAAASKPARLHVGGLPRHVTAAEVQDLFSRAIANDHLTGLEFTRDASTGLPRRFAYLGLSDAADAEAAVRALNGTRWKGSKLTVALAKEGYMARLQHEWAERSAAASAPAAVPAVTPIGLAKLIKKGLPPRILRIRKRPGQPPLLVDPVPQPGMKDMSSQEDAIAASQRKRKKAVDVVFRAKRLVRFDSAAHRGPPCKSIPQLWRDATSSSDSSSGMAEVGEEHDADAAAWQGLADLAPEETGAEEDMSFVWDANNDHHDGASTDNDDNDAAADGTDTALYHSDSDAENAQQQPKQRSTASADTDEWTKERALAGMADSSVQLVDSLVADKLAKFRKQPDPEDITSSSTAKSGALNKLRFTEGSRKRFAMDERFIDSSSDEEEDSKAAAAAQSYYDYEADTAVGGTSSSSSNSSAAATAVTAAAAAGAVAAAECDLDAETARSMAVLAAMFGGSVGDTSKPAPKRAAAFVPQVRFDPTTMVGAKQAKPAAAAAAAAVNAVAAKPAASHNRTAAAAAVAAASSDVTTAAAGAAAAAAGSGRVAVAALSSERFVTHLSSLTDIFKVQDKASTKMSEQEKARAIGFKVSSLFSSDATAEQPAAAAGSGTAPSDSAFSFGFDDESADASKELAAAAVAVTLPHDSEVDAALRDLDSAASARAEVQQIEVRGLWSSMDSVRQGAALFCRQESESAIEERWLHSRRNLTADFKRKHKTALKNKGAAPVLQKRRRVF
jgi:RNA recognition motif. (a.k.a. RRM, RBD, or RNP domain)